MRCHIWKSWKNSWNILKFKVKTLCKKVAWTNYFESKLFMFWPPSPKVGLHVFLGFSNFSVNASYKGYEDKVGLSLNLTWRCLTQTIVWIIHCMPCIALCWSLSYFGKNDCNSQICLKLFLKIVQLCISNCIATL